MKTSTRIVKYESRVVKSNPAAIIKSYNNLRVSTNYHSLLSMEPPCESA